MRRARVAGDDDGLKRWEKLIESEAAVGASAYLEAQYQLCLRARDRMDLEGIANGLVRIASEEPIWKLRRAALHTEIGGYVKATKLIKEATTDLERRHKLDRNSLAIKSLLAWANWVSRATEHWRAMGSTSLTRPRDFRELDIDPAGEIEHIETDARRIEKERREAEVEIQPAFGAGHYRSGSQTIQIGRRDQGIALAYEFDQLTERVGLPIRINHVNICAHAALATAELAYQPTVEWYVWLLRALHSHLDKAFDRYFGRIAIAQMPVDVSATLITAIEAAIQFWTAPYKGAGAEEARGDFGCALDSLRLLLAALSRLTVRMTEEQAKRTFERAVEMATDPQILHHWLLDALGDLAKFAAEAIAAPGRGTLAQAVIQFPLASEKNTSDRFWPLLVNAIWDSKPDRDLSDPNWDARVQQLISASDKGQPARGEAILRLVYLALGNALKPGESEAFGRALWSDLDDNENPLPTNLGILLTTSLAGLPAPEGIDVKARLGSRLFGADLRKLMAFPSGTISFGTSGLHQQLLLLLNINYAGLALPPADAIRMFDEIVAWRSGRRQIGLPVERRL